MNATATMQATRDPTARQKKMNVLNNLVRMEESVRIKLTGNLN